MDIDKIPPDVFVKSVVYGAHQKYGRGRVKIRRVKSMKMVIKAAEMCSYDHIAHGFYMFGDYSFRVHTIFDEIFDGPSLHGMRKDRSINMELVSLLDTFFDDMQHLLTGRFSKFIDWAHIQEVPQEYLDFYLYSDLLRKNIEILPNVKRKDVASYYDEISGNISNLDACLNHVPKERLLLYFKFTDLLEGVLIVCRHRNFNYYDYKAVMKDLAKLYKYDVASLLYPYLETMKGEDTEFEKREYNERIEKRMNVVPSGLTRLEARIAKRGFKPTLEELDAEISSDMRDLDGAGKKQVLSILGYVD